MLIKLFFERLKVLKIKLSFEFDLNIYYQNILLSENFIIRTFYQIHLFENSMELFKKNKRSNFITCLIFKNKQIIFLIVIIFFFFFEN